MAATLSLGLCTFLFLALGVNGAQVTPMQQVIKLLKDLTAKVTASGAEEAAQYDKYACFCKEQADLKYDSISKSNKQIDDLSAEIKALDTAISQLNSEISKLAKGISVLDGEIQRKTDIRNGDHNKYLAKAKDMNEAIDACEAAIDTLKSSKSAMEDAKLGGGGDLLQVQKATSAVLSSVSLHPSLVVAPETLALLSDVSGKGAPKYQYQANDIIATIESLRATFKSMKEKLDEEEFYINSTFESEKLGLDSEKRFKEEDKSEKETIVESKTEAVNTAREDKGDETKAMNADQIFMDELTEDCKAKAGLFDQRSKMRADELTALSEATEELVKGTLPNYGATGKLAAVAIKAAVKKSTVRPASFLQVLSQQQQEDSHKQAIVDKVLSLLNAAAGRTGSATLASAAVKVKLSEDHFVKVRRLIKDLMTKLKNDAKSEATQKSFCDTSMKKGTSHRDDANAKIEMANAKITTLTSKQNSLQDDIRELEKDVAGVKKGHLEDTELRNEEKAELQKTDNMSDEAIESVKRALALLQKFYSNALLQKGEYVPANADREGNVMGDMAPKVFEKKYHASQKESKGIIGILEVILSDFERTENKAEADEAASKASYDTLENKSKESVEDKQKEMTKKRGEVSDAKSDILTQQQALFDAKDLLQSSQESLEDLEAMCVKGEETWAERKKKREDEIQALQEAVEILDNWKGS